ncbi:MAG: hypothetical protein V1793_22310 [Pseudomonadota bacterium]
MIYSEKGFEIELTGNELEFSGKLEKMDYSEIDQFLRDVDAQVSGDVCILRFNRLAYLNSSGIRAVASFVIESSKRFEIHIDRAVTWQKTNIPVLETLKPDRIRIVS